MRKVAGADDMFLSDRTIKYLVTNNTIGIDPFDIRNVQPCSYDLTLGDVQTDPVIKSSSIYWIIRSHQFLLATTLERIRLPAHIAGTASGKSTWGRKGLVVENAGHIDHGFPGDLTLELFNYSDKDIEMRKGESICQIIFVYLDMPAEHPYSGRYVDQRGITPARPPKPTE